MKPSFFAFVFSLLLAWPAFALPVEISLKDGTILRLSGVDSPVSYLAEAKRLLAGFEIRPPDENAKTDRYGRRLGQFYAADGTWLQGELLKNGLARVQTTKGDADLAQEMYALEDQARREKRGLWTDNAFAVRALGNIGEYKDSFQIVEGTVLDAVARRDRFYLNFGPDWKTDFTASMPASVAKRFSYDLLSLNGKKIRIRGWVEEYNGPMIELTHPEQLEILEP